MVTNDPREDWEQEETGRKWDKVQAAIIACRYAAIKSSSCLEQNLRLQTHSVSAFCGESYTPGVRFVLGPARGEGQHFSPATLLAQVAGSVTGD